MFQQARFYSIIKSSDIIGDYKMTTAENKLNINTFYPEESLEITNIDYREEKILIQMRSITNSCTCPKCKHTTDKYHGTYIRRVQDLPILGKGVQLEIKAHEYDCINSECSITSIAETFDGFLNTYSRMTERCADFICTLALETSCEGCARICRKLGIKISGDTVIRLLLKKYENLPEPETGDVIGVDDFAYKKRQKYGTIIVNKKTHEPIALLEGRDGKTLREWLKKNKNIKVVTRDRASAYAKVISKELPDAMQIADRFHLHQNLLEAIKKALNQELPATIIIPHEGNHDELKVAGKKNRI